MKLLELILEKVKKVNGGFVIVHCSKKDKGKRINATKKPITKKKALSIHRAIMVNKMKKA